MGLYEQMCNEFATGILASNEEMVAHMRIAGWRAPLYNISGLAFNKSEVLERVGGELKPFHERAKRVVFAARWDQEKQPGFFMDIVESCVNATDPVTFNTDDIEFAILQGGPLRSNVSKHVERARKLEAEGKLKIYENLNKNDYYNIVNDSRVMINTALQDWTSNTVSEADALGCNVLFPAYRSFPEIFANDHTRMYVPWSKDDAINKLWPLLDQQHLRQGEISDWTDATIDRYIDIMTGKGQQWRRDDNCYRDHLAERKY
jgi:hypothetical protein